MKRLTKYALLFTLVLVFSAVFLVPASADTSESYEIFVGRYQVTSENAHDILGDGTAVYDKVNQILTLKNYREETVRRMEENGQMTEKAMSVFVGINSAPITIVIEGECHFVGGIYNALGNVKVQDAEVTFARSVPVCIFVHNGTLEVSDSEMELEEATFLAPLFSSDEMSFGFFAGEIAMEDSEFIFDVDTAEYYNLDRVSALFCAAKSISLLNCDVTVHTPFPVFQNVFNAYTEHLTFSQCDFSLVGQNCCFLANGVANSGQNSTFTELPAVRFNECDVKVKNSYVLLMASALVVEDSEIDASLYYAGMNLTSPKKEASYIFNNSKVSLRALDREHMEKNIWEAHWSTLPAEQKAAWAYSFVAYLQDAIAKTNLENGGALARAGIMIENGVSFFEKTRISIKGFSCGYVAWGETIIKLFEKTYMDLSATKSAFTVCSTLNDALQSDVEVTYGKKTLSQIALPEEISATVGAYLYSATKAEDTLSLGEGELSYVWQVIDRMSGQSQTLTILSEGAFNPQVLWVYGGIALLVAAIAVMYFVWIRNKTTEAERELDA